MEQSEVTRIADMARALGHVLVNAGPNKYQLVRLDGAMLTNRETILPTGHIVKTGTYAKVRAYLDALTD